MILGNTNRSKSVIKLVQERISKKNQYHFQECWHLAKCSGLWLYPLRQWLDLCFLGHGVLSFSVSLDTLFLRNISYYHNLATIKITPTLLPVALNSLLSLVLLFLCWMTFFSIPMSHLFISESRKFFHTHLNNSTHNIHIHFNMVSHQRQDSKIHVFQAATLINPIILLWNSRHKVAKLFNPRWHSHTCLCYSPSLKIPR